MTIVFLLQRDNAQVHKARFSKIGVEELDWPGQSRDVSPIQHLWNELDGRLRARTYQPNKNQIKKGHTMIKMLTSTKINGYGYC